MFKRKGKKIHHRKQQQKLLKIIIVSTYETSLNPATRLYLVAQQESNYANNIQWQASSVDPNSPHNILQKNQRYMHLEYEIIAPSPLPIHPRATSLKCHYLEAKIPLNLLLSTPFTLDHSLVCDNIINPRALLIVQLILTLHTLIMQYVKQRPQLNYQTNISNSNHHYKLA